jgi:hypothetical protein
MSVGVNMDGEYDRLVPRTIPFLPYLRSVFEAIEEHSRTRYGYASIEHVDRLPAQLKNEMPRWVAISF